MFLQCVELAANGFIGGALYGVHDLGNLDGLSTKNMTNSISFAIFWYSVDKPHEDPDCVADPFVVVKDPVPDGNWVGIAVAILAPVAHDCSST